MMAFIIFVLRSIHSVLDESVPIWEPRVYRRTVVALRTRWHRSRLARSNLWDEVVPALLKLAPRFNAVTVASITHNGNYWCDPRCALLPESVQTRPERILWL